MDGGSFHSRAELVDGTTFELGIDHRIGKRRGESLVYFGAKSPGSPDARFLVPDSPEELTMVAAVASFLEQRVGPARAEALIAVAPTLTAADLAMEESAAFAVGFLSAIRNR